MATQLSLYKGAARALGESRLSSLTDDVPLRYELDSVWDDNFIRDVLRRGYWNFAIRTVQAESDPGATPDFGYRLAFEKPSDWIRTAAVCRDEYFEYPETRYADEVGFWYADIEPLYIKFVSDDVLYGGALQNWPESFTRYAEHRLAQRVIKPVLQPSELTLNEFNKEVKSVLVEARSEDAMNEPTKFMPQGTWSQSRRGRRYRIGFTGGSS